MSPSWSWAICCLLASVNLSSRYINDRYLPDKAIDLIDEAASRKRIEIDSKPDELDDVIKEMILKLGGIVDEVIEPFNPEGGAYGIGRTHSHKH